MVAIVKCRYCVRSQNSCRLPTCSIVDLVALWFLTASSVWLSCYVPIPKHASLAKQYYLSTRWYGMEWYGMVWYGMVWYGMLWYGMVWYDTVSMPKPVLAPGQSRPQNPPTVVPT